MLWLWYRPVAVAPIGPLAWELPYAAAGVALKRKRKKKKKREMKSRMAANSTKRETMEHDMLPDKTHNTDTAC